MPSSVVFAALVLAWLLVLVPVVARRRGMVPRTAEADLSARVLLRGAGGPAMEKIAMEEVPVADAHQDRRGSAAMSVASGGAATAVADRPDVDRHDVDRHDVDRHDVDRHDVDQDDMDRDDMDQELDRELELDAHDGGHLEGDVPHPREQGAARPGPSREHVLDRHGEGEDEWYGEDDDAEPRSYRPGRGGFDPEAAEVAAHARYAFRQRVALGLIAVAVLSALAALTVTSALWWLHVVTDLVLVGYLVFLRRQTRIEEEVRTRRVARMSGERRALEARRERQAAHDDLMAAHQREAEDWDEWDTGSHAVIEREDPIDDVDEEPAPRWAAPRTPAPPVPEGMELVDDSDDDPAFHDLDDRDRVPSYRRAAAGA